jgi:thiol-disulfide isomerase/thioredoxin
MCAMKTIENYSDVSNILNQDLVMVVAKTHTCSTCQMIVPHLEKNVKYLDKFNQYQIFIDDIDQFRGEYVIFSVPTVLIYSNGKELLRESRFINIEKINRLLEAYLD